MKQFKSDKIKNVALAGHGGGGKTSLAEAMLFIAGASDRLGKVSDGNTICDFDAEEIKRKASVSLSIAPFIWKDTKINLLDTPGLFDFAAGFYEGMRAAETVLIPVSARSGVAFGAEKAYKLARKTNKNKIFFVNKLDSDNADFFKVLNQLRSVFGSSVCPLVVPYIENEKVSCYIDLLEMQAYKYNNGKAQKIDIPAAASDIIETALSDLNEAVAETDEALMDKFFSGEPFTKEELLQGVSNGIKANTLAPVFCGSALNLEGIDLLMNAIVSTIPSAAEHAGEIAVDQSGNNVEIKCNENDPLAAFIFKTVADPFVGKLSYFKVVSGKLTSDLSPINSRTEQPERLGKILFVKGKKQEDSDCIVAGDIGAVSKLSEAATGDSFCDPKRVVSFKTIDFPKPCLSMAVTSKSKGDEGKISQGMRRIMDEDLTVNFETNPETKQQILSGLGEQHLDVVCSKMKNKFGAEIQLATPRVAYRETIRKKVKVQGRHKKQSGGSGQFGDVWIEFEPCDTEDMVFEEKVFGGSVPKNFFPAVEKGLREAIQSGVLAGYPMVGLKATLVDGSYHPVDSNEQSFRMAAHLAYKAGIPQASPTLLEPIGSLKAVIPDANTGDVMGDLNKRRGRVLGMNQSDEEGSTEIEAEVPMSEMHDFATALRSITQGRGRFEFNFVRYEMLPSMLEASVIEAAKALKTDE
ncbi:MAG: elongation factor G [Oscillospiraceae bacterium]|nr:elongation factor G [Oscillospiraceae bacterium]